MASDIVLPHRPRSITGALWAIILLGLFWAFGGFRMLDRLIGKDINANAFNILKDTRLVFTEHQHDLPAYVPNRTVKGDKELVVDNESNPKIVLPDGTKYQEFENGTVRIQFMDEHGNVFYDKLLRPDRPLDAK